MFNLNSPPTTKENTKIKVATTWFLTTRVVSGATTGWAPPAAPTATGPPGAPGISSSPWAFRRVTTSAGIWGSEAASWRGCTLWVDSAFTFAPLAMRNLIISKRRPRQAICRGVRFPLVSLFSRSAPASTKTSTASACPADTALDSAVSLSKIPLISAPTFKRSSRSRRSAVSTKRSRAERSVLGVAAWKDLMTMATLVEKTGAKSMK
mmetsp:Transcript_5242/g.10389  ORF Transcript_5242/g.10389 Transcript_5242/m.10389 type:complete len:208 (+) Transcript_5242:993-1616(+)